MGIFDKIFGKGKSPQKQNKEEIYDLFQNMETQGVFIHQDFLWSFFFDSNSKEALESIIIDLKNIDFTDFKIDKEETHYTLKAELVKEFTEESFSTFYEKCFEVGKTHKMDHYGDFEVGNKDPLKPIEKDEKFPGLKWTVKKPMVDGLPRNDVINTAFINFKYKSEFPYGFYVTIYFESDNKYRLPNEEQKEEFEKFEIKLKKLLRQHCQAYWIYRMTWDEDRTNYFQVDDINKAQKAVEKLQLEYADLCEIHTNSEFDPEWKQVTQMITY